MALHDTSDIVETLDAEIEDAVSAVPIYTINSYPTDPTLEVLLNRSRRNEIQIPSFQRGWIWTHTQASQLIESFLLGLPVPGIFLYREPITQHLLVIDGQQRLQSIRGFFDGRLPNVSEFYLRDVDPRWEGKNYDDLIERDRIRLRDAVLRAIIVEQSSPDDDSSVYHIFERLNTGGTQLNPQEIRNSAAHGPFNDLIIELNDNPDWRLIFGKPDADARMRDVELIVRFQALLESSHQYAKPMKTFLTGIPHMGSLQAQRAIQTRWWHHSQVLQGQSNSGLSNKGCDSRREPCFLSVFVVFGSPPVG